ncbi:hypothetical protein IEO21_01042 [Rhodonia placenta]|uniref:F-box domain-containing protein n=1 Tax=Rhodonia placenta TaxID=104341 RepID=A0A8H7PA73_9APHY|nr:hypothetical protein IEO21_01042 [Postia placenta]
MTLVCRDWRDLIIDTPTLWQEYSGVSLPWLHLCLIRSAPAPVDITYWSSTTFLPMTVDIGPNVHGTVMPFDILVPHADRIRRLHMVCGDFFLSGLASMLATGRNFAMVEDLGLYEWTRDSVDMPSVFPHVRSLTVDLSTIDLSAPKRLTRLTIRNAFTSPNGLPDCLLTKLLDMLEDSPELEHLEITQSEEVSELKTLVLEEAAAHVQLILSLIILPETTSITALAQDGPHVQHSVDGQSFSAMVPRLDDWHLCSRNISTLELEIRDRSIIKSVGLKVYEGGSYNPRLDLRCC